jgi:hypothetical protein
VVAFAPAEVALTLIGPKDVVDSSPGMMARPSTPEQQPPNSSYDA